ncbi:MAG: hypothetical protein HWN66_11405 [Candidatus Helarchaeota archaeon]|nr:hypothetical protein [Candidatus Helarchaeota archaeon]
MGSKRLKAIASRGKAVIQVADKEAYKENAKDRYNWVNESLLKMSLEVYGTAVMLDTVAVKGGLPTRNWQTGVFPNFEKLNGTAIVETILTDRKACFACPIACGRISEIKEGPYKSKGEGPEYETLGAYGTMCGIDDLAAVTLAHFLCNEYGLDTISAGSTIAFAMECFEKGILTKKDTDGIELKFGDGDAIIALTHKIAKREGFGDLLAEGSRIMAEKLNKGSEKFAMNVKGLELPAYDPRAAKICGLAFAVANRGGDHITAYIEGPAFLAMPFLIIDAVDLGDILQEIPETTKAVKDMEDALIVFDSIGGCKFMGMVLTREDWAKMISSLTGWTMTSEDFSRTGARIINLQRAFNCREGASRADDTLPKRLLEDPMPEGEGEGQVVNLDPLLDAYYKFRGWDKDGKPTPETLEALGLEWLIGKF